MGTHGPITTLIHALVYTSQQYRAAKRDGDEQRAAAIRKADTILIAAKEELYAEIPSCAPAGCPL